MNGQKQFSEEDHERARGTAEDFVLYDEEGNPVPLNGGSEGESEEQEGEE